jgi:hypothetical protein
VSQSDLKTGKHVVGIGCFSEADHTENPATGMTFNIRIGGQVVGSVTALAGHPFTIADHQLRADLRGSSAVVLRVRAERGERTIAVALGSVVAISPDEGLEVELVESGDNPTSAVATAAESACAQLADSSPVSFDGADPMTNVCWLR